MDGVRADALEAIELYRGASQMAWDGACDAEIRVALLQGEVEADPSAEYRALYSAKSRRRNEPCTKRIDETLVSLAAFRPAPDVLADIERQAGGPPRASAPAVAASGSVVVPKLPPEPPKEPARITEVQHYKGKDAARVVVLVTHPTLFEVGQLEADAHRGPRLFVDIKHSKYRGRHELGGEGLVERVRIGEQGDATRVVLDLKSSAYRRVFYLPEPFRLVVDVFKEPPSAHEGERGPRPIRRLVLDPGHGGQDPGAQGAGGLREKDVVLDIAHRAAPLLARELGISTLLTRDSDAFVPLDERVARANAFLADLFVSIHCNASEAAGGRGVMTFVLDASRDDVAARVAARENSASEQAASEFANAMSYVLDAGSIARSTHFAELLQRSAMSSLAPKYPETHDHGVKSAGFYVLAGARMPAALFEVSFISNPVEERRLDTADYRQKIADSIVNAVRAYRDGL
jgi:N-acetylmuramoyl-L-alanine amidase